MKKIMGKLKYILAWALCVLAWFIIISLYVFCGGWELFESGNPIKIELGAAVIFGILFFVIIDIIYELEKQHDEKIKKLEKRIQELENKEE